MGFQRHGDCGPFFGPADLICKGKLNFIEYIADFKTQIRCQTRLDRSEVEFVGLDDVRDGVLGPYDLNITQYR